MKSDSKGFSLLELLVYMAILAIMSTIIVNVFLGITSGRGKFAVEADVNSNLRFALEKIGQDIRAASSVDTPSCPLGDCTSPSATSSTLVMTVGTDTIAYCVSGGVLRYQLNDTCGASSPTVTSDEMNVTSLVFTRLQNTNLPLPTTAVSIRTSITIAYAGTNPNLQYSATRTVTGLLPYFNLLP